MLAALGGCFFYAPKIYPDIFSAEKFFAGGGGFLSFFSAFADRYSTRSAFNRECT